MYDLSCHKENNADVVRDFIQRCPLATLMGRDIEQRTASRMEEHFTPTENGTLVTTESNYPQQNRSNLS